MGGREAVKGNSEAEARVREIVAEELDKRKAVLEEAVRVMLERHDEALMTMLRSKA